LEEEHLHISLGTEEKVECHHAFGIFPVNHMCQQLHPKNIPADINITHKLILTISYSSHFCHTQQPQIRRLLPVSKVLHPLSTQHGIQSREHGHQITTTATYMLNVVPA
jgi:hypothetical protein